MVRTVWRSFWTGCGILIFVIGIYAEEARRGGQLELVLIC